LAKFVATLSGSPFQLSEIEPARVVELVPRDTIQYRLNVLNAAGLESSCFIENLLFGWLENAIKPAKDGKGQNDFAILSGFIRTAEQIRN
jgi:hypothetical protein